jgi:alpha-1,2-mannosyltransferase
MRSLPSFVRDLPAAWRREPVLGALAALGAALLLAYPVYLSARVYVPVWTGAQETVLDFAYFYDAAVRFARAPLDLYPDPFGYMYPPPSVVLFLPLAALPMPVAFLLSVLAIAATAVLAVWLAIRLYERWRGAALPAALRASLLLIGLATAPVFQNLKWGQVNVLVLLSGLGFLWLLERGRPFAAALVLSGGFWLKLYPLALALLGLRRGEAPRLAAGFALGLVGVPLVLLPFVPAELYRQYVLDLMPVWTSLTNVDALNQSITGVLTHLRLPLEPLTTAYDTPVSTTTKAVNTVASAGLLGGVYAAYFLGRLPRVPAGFALLAVLPVISVLGWEHTYVLALPLYLLVLLEAHRRGPWAKAVAGLGVLVFMVPKLPVPAMEWTFAHWPRPVVDAFYARFLIVTLVFLVLGIAWARGRRENARPGSRSRRGASDEVGAAG